MEDQKDNPIDSLADHGDFGGATIRAIGINDIISSNGLDGIDTPQQAQEKLIQLYPELEEFLSGDISGDDTIGYILLSFFDIYSGIPYFLVNRKDDVKQLIEKCQKKEYFEEFNEVNPQVLQFNDSKMKRFTLLFSMGLHTMAGRIIR